MRGVKFTQSNKHHFQQNKLQYSSRHWLLCSSFNLSSFYVVFYLVFSSVYWKKLITILHNLPLLMAYKAKEGEPQDDTEEQDCSNNRKGNSGFLNKNFYWR